MLRRKFLPLRFVYPKKDFLRNPFTHEVRQFRRHMESVPKTAEVMEVRFRGVGRRVESKGVGRYVALEVIPDDGSFVQRDESVPRAGGESKVQDVGKRKRVDDLNLQFIW